MTKQNTNTRWLGTQQRVATREGELRWKWNLRRLLPLLGGTVVACYLLMATAGYIWLKESRNARTLSFSNVLLLQRDEVKSAIAKAHLEKARSLKEKLDYQQAYLAYVSALRSGGRDPALRLEVAEFLSGLGWPKQAITVLEQGLGNKEGRTEVGLRLMDLLRRQRLESRILDLLREPLSEELKGVQALRFRTYQIEATLAVMGASEAQRLLEAHPDVANSEDGALLYAEVLWDQGRRNEAITRLRQMLANGATALPVFIKLCGYQEQLGQAFDLQATASDAVRAHPGSVQARLLKIGSLRGVGLPGSEPWRKEVEAFLRDFGSRADALVALGELGGRKGWVDFTRTLYAGSLTTGRLVGMLGLCYADALLRSGRASDARRVLDELSAQVGDVPSMAVYLRRRQVLAAAAAGADLAMRDHARGLAVLLASDPTTLEATRQQFLRAGLVDAAAELGAKTKSGTAGRTP